MFFSMQRALFGVLFVGCLHASVADVDAVTGKSILPDLHVDCGGHYAETCAVCSQGHQERWCNGECTWVWSACQYTTGYIHFLSYLNLLYDFAILLFVLWYTNWYVWLALLILMTIYAGIYKGSVADQYPDTILSREVDFEDFVERDLGLFVCFRRAPICMWALFCTPVLAAKNFQVGKACGFWPAYLIMTGMYTPFCCITAFVYASMSNTLLRNITLSPSFGGSLFSGLCCMCCNVGRQALEVDNATYVENTCAFNVEVIYGEDGVEEEEEHGGCCGTYHKRRCCGGGGDEYDREHDGEHTGHKHGRGCCGWGQTEEEGVYHTHEEHEHHYEREEAARSCGFGS